MTPTNLTLYSTILKLTPTDDGVLSASQGRLVQGAFLDLIRSIDPGLAAALHAENQRRPYTLSSLLDAAQPKKDQVKLRAGQRLSLRFTLLGSDLFTTFSRFLLSPPAGRLPTLRLGNLSFVITEMLTTPGSHRWAGYTRLDDLCRRWRNDPLDETVSKIRLHFASGVMFSRSGNKAGLGKFLEFYPSPEMFFGSVEARWRELTNLPSPLTNKELREFARETIVVSAFNIKTVRRTYWGKPHLGGAGQLTYELRDTANVDMTRFLNLLVDFAFYSGVGAKTTIGMGQVRRAIRNYERSN